MKNKKFLPLLLCLLLLPLAGCDSVKRMIGHAIVPERVTIDGVTYRTGFYGDLYPVFGSVGDIGSVTRQKEIIYDDGMRTFHRVTYQGHDWVHSHIGRLGGGVVYCAESQWEQMRVYYADPSHFTYYYGIGYYVSETAVQLPEMDPEKFEALLAFGDENGYDPFDERANEIIMQKARRLPESEFQQGVCFYKVSEDGYFMTVKQPMYFVRDGKLLLVFVHDGGRDNGGVKEVLAVDVPDALGRYFIELMERYPE
jgi:hypothetical protein